MRRLRELLPCERFVYFGDTARMPYGGRTYEEIRRFGMEIVSYFVRHHDVKAVVVACNTSSSLALDDLRSSFAIPIVGMVEPGAAAAARVSKSGRIGVIATEGTIRSGSYSRAIRRILPSAFVQGQACPRLVPLVEAGKLSGPEVDGALREYLGEFSGSDIDTLVLGCTHYPYLLAAIRRIVGQDIPIVDPADEVAAVARNMLEQLGLLARERSGPDVFLTSGDPGDFERLGSRLLGQPIHGARHVDLEKEQ